MIFPEASYRLPILESGVSEGKQWSSAVFVMLCKGIVPATMGEGIPRWRATLAAYSATEFAKGYDSL